VDEACSLAERAFDAYRSTSLETRATFLEAIAQGLLDAGDDLVDRVMSETALPRPRVEGERGRTVGQLRLFAEVVRGGSWIGAVLDSALPERVPTPRPDLRRRKIPLGPVAVFGASNFPLAYSVAGGDTASALAAGCPVVAKSHPSHPGTCEIVGRIIQKAVSDCKLPEGVFSLLVGVGNSVGEALVAHKAIQAVGFTGSRKGGLALAAIAARRPQPIPVFAEMSSTNPVFILPGALKQHGTEIAEGLINSATQGAGQFCTKPGIVVAMRGSAFQQFEQQAAAHLAEKPSSMLLNPAIQASYQNGITRRKTVKGVRALAEGHVAGAVGTSVQALLFTTEMNSVHERRDLSEEIFGPSSLLAACSSEEEMLAMAEELEGQLTATIHMTDKDLDLARSLVAILERKAGRIVINGFPTGVEVLPSMVHGGPFPSTTDSRFTAVGPFAIERFLRPVCYQNFPSQLLPVSLQDGNPLFLSRLRDGKVELA
jgi:alpha-ketoglutaric semialdehyde dehydrogenase